MNEMAIGTRRDRALFVMSVDVDVVLQCVFVAMAQLPHYIWIIVKKGLSRSVSFSSDR